MQFYCQTRPYKFIFTKTIWQYQFSHTLDSPRCFQILSILTKYVGLQWYLLSLLWKTIINETEHFYVCILTLFNFYFPFNELILSLSHLSVLTLKISLSHCKYKLGGMFKAQVSWVCHVALPCGGLLHSECFYPQHRHGTLYRWAMQCLLGLRLHSAVGVCASGPEPDSRCAACSEGGLRLSLCSMILILPGTKDWGGIRPPQTLVVGTISNPLQQQGSWV